MADNTKTFKERVNLAIIRNDARSAWDLYLELTDSVASAGSVDPAELKSLESIRLQLAAVCMRLLSDQTVEKEFEKAPALMINAVGGRDFIENLKGYLANHLAIEDRNNLRTSLRKAMLRSNEVLGSTQIQLGTEQVSSTVQNWLKLYISEVGNKQATSVQRARFFAQNPSVRKLKSIEKDALKALIDVYEYLLIPSDSLEGYEDTIYIEDESGMLKVVEDGTVSDVYDKNTLKELHDQAKRGELPRDQLAELAVRFPKIFDDLFTQNVGVDTKVLTPGDIAQQVQAFMQAQRSRFAHRVAASGVPLPNRTAALVAMLHKAMARGQEADMVLAKEILIFVLSDQDRFVNFMRHSSILTLLQTELPASIGEKNKEVVRQSPTSPMALQALLQIVFSQRFKLSPEEAVWQSFDVIQRLPMALKELKTVVTYDPGQNALVWRY